MAGYHPFRRAACVSHTHTHYPAVTLLQEQLKGAHAATVRAMRVRYPRWTDELMQRKRLKYAKGRPLETMLAPKRQRLEERAMASAFAVIIQGYEDESLMTAAQVLEEGGWMVHSYQQASRTSRPRASRASWRQKSGPVR